MTTQDVAQKLVNLCREGQFEKAQKELYSQDAVSLEPAGTPNAESKGLDALLKKAEMFNNDFEVHSNVVSDPVVADNFFSITMKLDATHKPSGQKMPMEEVCVYEVKDGKIVLEQFFYSPPPQG